MVAVTPMGHAPTVSEIDLLTDVVVSVMAADEKAIVGNAFVARHVFGQRRKNALTGRLLMCTTNRQPC